jgi:heterodisulfide reductase subunit C
MDDLAQRHGLCFCVECGKCVAVCPMGALFSDFHYEASPRGMIEHALMGLEVEGHAPLWLCLTCDSCTRICPQGVKVKEFVEEARSWAVDSGDREWGSFCRDCGKYLWPLHTIEHMKRQLGEEVEGHLTLCPDCRRRDYGAKMRFLKR